MTLSVRVDRDIEPYFEQEVKRLKVTKSQFINDLLRSTLVREDAMQLLADIRSKYGIAEPGKGTPRTERSRNTRVAAAAAVKGKRLASGNR
jgi:hypothetical protein